jgi:lysophospholipase L1-like esterase
MLRSALLLMLLACLACPSTAAAAPLLRDGDRVVFFGDSITVAHTFSRAVEAYVLTRDPDKHVTFINAGVGGHTASDGLARLDVDVLAQHPSVVVINFGMNDSAYPDGTDGAAFEKNMGAIIDALQQAGVRHILWADTTPYDPIPGPKSGKSKGRSARIAQLVEYTAAESARRGLTLVRWHQPIVDAIDAWNTAKRSDKLIPDKVHPGPALHAIMATQLLRALGYVPGPVVIQGRFADGEVRFRSGGPATLPWDAVAPLSVHVSAVAPPLTLIGSPKDAADLGAQDALALREVRLVIENLPPARRYRVQVGGADAGRFTAAQLARGTDIMATTTERPRPPAPPGTTMTVAATPPPTFAACSATSGNPWQNDHDCLWGQLFQKDQLRVAMRSEKTRWLPDFVADRRAGFLSFQEQWATDVDVAIRRTAQARMAAVHDLVLVPE